MLPRAESGSQEVELDFAYLQSQRIVAYDGKDPRSRSFDILRTEVLRSMDLKGWKTLAVTSPTPSCGKTLTAVNLALSMARQPERQVLLADLDLRKASGRSLFGSKVPRRRYLVSLKDVLTWIARLSTRASAVVDWKFCRLRQLQIHPIWLPPPR